VSFTERHVKADGFEIRYLEAGEGPPLVCFHGAGGLRLSRAHELLAERYRLIAFELPGFGASPINERSGSLAELAGTMGAATRGLGIERHSVWGISFGGKLALSLAVQAPERLEALVLAAPAAIRNTAAPLPPASEILGLLYSHPERRLETTPPTPEVDAKQCALVERLIGPPRDAELEAAMRELHVPTLVLFGTEDRLTPPELGRHYREILPDCQFVIVYDAAHALYDDRPEAFAATVADFLEHRDEFVVRHESGLLYP
jgi:pimeloyl-ACP methyl ester carboxylesterase